MERSARNGHLEVVKLLHQAGASCTAAAIHLAHVHGHHDIYHLLNAMHPGKVSTTAVVVRIIIRNNNVVTSHHTSDRSRSR